MKFRIEEIILPEQLQIAKLFECPICLGVLHNPVQTRCEHTFCADCLQNTRNGVCPMCKTENEEADVKLLKDVNLPMYRMMGKIPVVCPYRSPAAASSSQSAQVGAEMQAAKRARKGHHCSWSGSYSDLLESHLGECPCAPIECAYCHIPTQRADMASHEEQCEHRFEPCSICGERMHSEEEHMQKSALSHVAILQAQLQQAEQHGAAEKTVKSAVTEVADQIKKFEDKVLSVMATFAKTAQVTQKFSELKATLAVPVLKDEKFVVRVKGAAKLFRDYRHGCEWESPNRPDIPFRVSLYPNGAPDSDEACFGLFVEALSSPPGTQYVIKVAMGKESMTIELAKNDSMGSNNFGLQSALRAAVSNDTLEITLSVAHVSRVFECDV